LGIEVAGEDFL